MGPNIYKPGQGYWTRTMSAIGFGLIALMGGLWLADQFGSVHIEGIQNVYIEAAAFFVVVAIAGFFIYRYIGRKKSSVDFLVDTEHEMKKVNWSTRREIIGMTWVVIGLTVFIALLISVFDYAVFAPFFRVIKVLETGDV